MAPRRFESPSGLVLHVNGNGSIPRIEHGDITLNTFVATELEGGAANLYVRRLDGGIRFAPLLGPRSALSLSVEGEGLERPVDHGRGGLGGVAPAPPGNADPVADLGAVVLALDAEAHRADQRALGEADRPVEQVGAIRGTLPLDPTHSVGERVGVRDQERGRRDAAVVSRGGKVGA